MSGIVIIPSGSESNLQAAVASAGPVATAVDARTNGFRVSLYTMSLTVHDIIFQCFVCIVLKRNGNNDCFLSLVC